VEDIAWFQPHGAEMSEENWNSGFAKSLGVYLNGKGIHSIGPKGEVVIDDSFYIIFNAYHDPLSFTLPPDKYGPSWSIVLDTAKNIISEEGETYKAEDELKVEGRSVVVLKQQMHQARD
jgi:glycogen operon protein